MENNNNLLSVLTREGVLVKVSVSYWPGCKKLRPEDIGLERKDLSEQLISLGHKRLLPKDTLANLAVIEGRAHALVESNTFPFLNGVHGELAFKRRLAVQTARGNGFANGNSQGRLAEVLGRPLSPRVCRPIALDAREPRYSSF